MTTLSNLRRTINNSIVPVCPFSCSINHLRIRMFGKTDQIIDERTKMYKITPQVYRSVNNIKLTLRTIV